MSDPLKTIKELNALLHEMSINHALTIANLQLGEARSVQRLLSAAYKDLLNTTVHTLMHGQGIEGSFLRTNEFNTLMDEANGIIERTLKMANARTEEQMVRLIKAEKEAVRGMFETIGISTLGKAAPNLRLLNSIVKSRPFQGKLLKDWYGDLIPSTQKAYRQAVTLGMTLGESNTTIARRVAQQLNIKNRQAAAITRTAVNHTSTHARKTFFDEVGIKWVRFIATLDDRTTFACQSLDGQSWPSDKATYPPIHMQCRSTIVPLLEEGTKLVGHRKSSSGNVPANTTYKEWFKTQNEATQRKVLGPSRFEAFKKGKLDGKNLVNASLKPKTLEQLGLV